MAPYTLLKNILEKMIYAAASCAMLVAVVLTFSSSGAAQNHNPEFSVSNLHFDGSNYIFIGEDDGQAYDPRTKLVLNYREDEPEKGTVTLQWVADPDQDIKDGSSRVLAYGTESGTTGFTDGNGNTSTSGAWNWNEDKLDDYKGREMFLQGVADDSFAGEVVKLQASHTETVDDYAKEFTLLKVDVAAHVPAELVDGDNNLQTGAEIPAVDEDTASNLQFVVNDDNDRQRDFNASSYPKDLDLQNEFSGSEDDLVAVRFEFPADITSGTLEISANVDNATPEAQAFIITPANLAGSPIPPTKELVSLNPATSIDLSSASDTDLLWELADEGEQTLYVEGLAGKDDLEIKLSFKVNGTEMATESVHMQLLPSTERTLSVLAWPGQDSRAIVHMNNSDNVLREDNDGYLGNADRVTPIAFRQDGEVSSQGVPTSNLYWEDVNASNTAITRAIYDELEQQGRNVYICKYLYNAGGQSDGYGNQRMILGEPWTGSTPSGGPSKNILAHEWLHAFASHSHLNITNDIMWGTSPPPDEVDLNGNGILDGNESMVDEGTPFNVSQDQYNSFINFVE